MRRSYQLLCVVSAWALITVALLPKWTRTSTLISGSRGYFLSLRYYEQQTQATHNLVQLQCLANSYGMNLLEPYIEGSKFTSDISAIAKGKTCLKFRDLFDVDIWNEQTARFGYHGLASWSDFLKSAPKKLIIYCIRYRSPPILKSILGIKGGTGQNTHTWSEFHCFASHAL